MLPLELVEKAFAFNLLGQAGPLNPGLLKKYVDPLPIMGAVDATAGGMLHIEAKPNRVIVSTSMAAAVPGYTGTDSWSYRPVSPTAATAGIGDTYLGPSLIIRRGTPIKIEWLNNLKDAAGNPIPHPLPVDPSLHWAAVPAGDNMMMGPFPVNGVGQSTFDYTLKTVPLSPHVHGGEQAPGSDGGPETWFTPDFAFTGPKYTVAGDVGPGGTGQNNLYSYSNAQPTATIWYHDHALGITRLNVYMGLAGAYVIVDPSNDPTWLPTGTDFFGNPLDVPLVIQDRMFDVKGQLYFPALATNPTMHPFWAPEFFGDTMLVNGKIWPYMNVEPRAYRFRFLDGSNARFYELFLWNKVTNTPGPAFYQIATDGGFLHKPVMLNDPANPTKAVRLRIAPGERAECVIDFSKYAGKTLTLRNTAKAPFPKGAPANPKTTGEVMQFRVRAATGSVFAFPTNPLNPSLATYASTGTPMLGAVTSATPLGQVRVLTLNEVMGMGGPLEVLLNLTKWMAPTTELPRKGSTEVWRIVNTTADTHPIHLHLTQFQLSSRQPFNLTAYMTAFTLANGTTPIDGMTPNDAGKLAYTPVDPTPFLQSVPAPADRNERGWKDTIRMNPGEVTTIVVKFAPVDGTPDFPFDCTVEPGYVWHCHIIDHEDNEMMRPYKVVL